MIFDIVTEESQSDWLPLCLIRRDWLDVARAGLYHSIKFEPGCFVLNKLFPDKHLPRLTWTLQENPGLAEHMRELAVECADDGLFVAYKELLLGVMPHLERLSLSPPPARKIIHGEHLTVLIIRQTDLPFRLDTITYCPVLEELEFEVTGFKSLFSPSATSPSVLPLPKLKKLILDYLPSPHSNSYPAETLVAFAQFLSRVPPDLALLKIGLKCDGPSHLAYSVKDSMCWLIKAAGKSTHGGHFYLHAPFVWKCLTLSGLKMDRHLGGVKFLTLSQLQAGTFVVANLPLGLIRLNLDWVYQIFDPYHWWHETVDQLMEHQPALCSLKIKARIGNSHPWTEGDQERLNEDLDLLALRLRTEKRIETRFRSYAA